MGQLVLQDDGTDRTECILYDLADLEQVSSEENECVEQHIKILTTRMGEENQQKQCMFANSEGH